MPQIFLSYRRQDNDHALSLYTWLIKKYGPGIIFWDREAIEPGLDFAKTIETGLDRAAVFLAVIGKGWAEIRDEAGNLRLQQPGDWVRRETRAAIERGILVLPVLGSGATMPAPEELPDDLRGLSNIQALSITDMRFSALLEERIAAAGIHPLSGPPPELPAAIVASRAGNLLRRQAARLMIRAKELMGAHQSDRAIEELNEGTELMMALLDIVPGEREVDLQLGYIYAAMGRYFEEEQNRARSDRYLDLAAGIFQRVKDEVGPTPDAAGDLASTIKGLGEIYYNRGDLDTAIRYYKDALQMVPEYSYAWHDLFGALYAKAQRGSIDLAALRHSLDMTKRTSLGPAGRHPGLGEEYLAQLNRWLQECEERARANPHLEVGAVDRATEAIRANPNDGDAYLLRARARSAKLDSDGALEDYAAALAHGTAPSAALLERAYLLVSLGRYREAEQAFTAVIDPGDSPAEAFYYRGRARLELENPQGAEADFTAAIDLGSKSAYLYRAAVRMALEQYEAAEADLTQSIEAGESAGDAYLLRAKLRVVLGNSAGTTSDYLAAIENGRDAPDVLASAVTALAAEGEAAPEIEAGLPRALAQAAAGDTKAAATELEEAIDNGLDKPSAHYFLGKLRAESGDAAAAEESLTAALDASYSGSEVWEWRGRARLELGHFQGAEHDLDEAIRGGATGGETYFQRGHARLMQSNFAGAREDLTEAIARGYEKAGYAVRAMLGAMTADWEQCYADASQTLAAGLDVAATWRLHSRAASRLNRADEAEHDLSEAASREGETAELTICRGDLHLARSEFAGAAAAYRAVLEQEDTPANHFALGLALLLSGESEAATAEYTGAAGEASPTDVAFARREVIHWTQASPELAAPILALLQTGGSAVASA